MNISQLRYFVAVADHQSFTKAATQYYISQTAITQQVQALEEMLGVKLIDRSTRPISLTPGGLAFLPEAKIIIDRVESAIQRSQEASSGLTGSLRIGYTKGYEQSNLPQKLRAFRQEFPNVLITCYRNDTDMLAAGLLRTEYDIIFTWDSTNIRQEESLHIQLAETVPLYVAMYSSHPLARRPYLTRRDLKGERILFMSPSSDGDSFGDAHYVQLYQKAGYQPDILLRSSDYESILMMISAEEAICIVPKYCIGHLGGLDNIVFCPLHGEGETEEVLAVWQKKNQNPALKHFISKL